MNTKLQEIIKTHNIGLIRKELQKQWEEKLITTDELLPELLNYAHISFAPLKALYNEGATEDCFVKDVAKWIVENNQQVLINSFLSQQLCTVMDLLKAALTHENLSMIDYLLNDDNFYLSPEKKLVLHIESYRHTDMNFINQFEKVLFKGDYELDDKIISHQGKVSLLTNIFLSGNTENVEKLHHQFGINLDARHTVEEAYKSALVHGFLHNFASTQEKVLSFIINIPKCLVSDFIINTYTQHMFSTSVANKDEKLSYVLFHLIEKGFTTLEGFKEMVRIKSDQKEKFLIHYDIFSEKEKLNNIMTQESSIKKMKI
jgi:2-hydroxy-3-keto-5-methylthiopentenyl-1-phosphate phosphatase